SRHDVSLIVEPKAAVLAEHIVGSLEIAAVADGLRQPLVIDLRHVDGGVPGREQSRRADRAAHLVGQRVHAVAEDGALVRIGVDRVVPRRGPEMLAHGPEYRVAVGLERVVARPDLADDLHPGIAAARMDADEPPARAERLNERPDDLAGLELDWRARS